ncbi:ATP-binding protein [candidate division KSB1 bacterium]
MAKHNLLIVDDDADTVQMLTDFLAAKKFNVDSAMSGDEALKIIEGKNYDVVISDQKMPGISGAEFLEKVKSLNNDSVRILVSGYSDFQDALVSINRGEIFRFLQKPVDLNELENCINQGLDIFEAKVFKNKRLKSLETKIQQLVRVGNALSFEHDVNKLLDLIVREARKITCSDAGSLYRILDDKLVFEVAQNETLSKRSGKDLPFKRMKLPLSKESIAGYVALTGEIIKINDVYKLTDDVPYHFNPDFDKNNNYRTQSVLAVPILDYYEKIIGVVQLINACDDNKNVTAFSDEDTDLILTFASQTGVAIQSAEFIEEIKSLDKMKTKFMTVSGHELRTPVTIINEYTKILLEGVAGELTKEQKEILDTAAKNTEHLKELVEDILAMIKLDFKKEQLVLEDISIINLIKETIKSFFYFIKERNLSIKVGKSSDVILQGDRKKLRQLFTNIIGNAVKYTPDGGEIKFLVFQNPTHAKIVIQDTGIGIESDQKEKIFDKFYQIGDESIHSTSKTKFMGGGPGLGLAISKGIVEEHSGKIWAESEGENKGSKFNIILPLKQKEVNKNE